MALPKKHGGLGFQDIQLFNEALIAKQIWKLVAEPDKLVSKVLKSKYYPNSDLFEAQQNQNCSWLWSCWLSVLGKCSRWMRKEIRDGKNTAVWDTHWIIDRVGLPVELNAGIDRNIKWVRDLMNEDGNA
ncbi:Uncharacterized mitochondrial protein AtMg00310 [Striga hermonthica]|uniref:Uncharacterized mitochondrial protein AtMg00310 n=1 Tax=Striga hermonthica TaxID=68872 RepID=A0A9N7NNR4_STRHE|nr:Uncharacterized mitochondrial protein AtMg00310 [Striga hermonthica]